MHMIAAAAALGTVIVICAWPWLSAVLAHMARLAG